MDPKNPLHTVCLPSSSNCKLLSWSVCPGDRVRKGRALCSYTTELVGGGGGDGERIGSITGDDERFQLKSSVVGVVKEIMAAAGASVDPG